MLNPQSLDEQLGHPRILVLGDAMLDRYTWGCAERVSPEAPVLILRTAEREVRLGGAASVAVLLRALEVEVTLAAVIGDDHDGRTVRRLIEEAGIDASPTLADVSRPTTVKERFLGRSDQHQPHQMLRVDSESRTPLDDELVESMLERLTGSTPQLNPSNTPSPESTFLQQHAAVLISDYGKGCCTPQMVSEVIKRCRNAGIPVLVDPARGVGFEIYRHASLIKPNRLEAELAIGHPITSVDEACIAAATLRERFEIETVLITLDRDGLVFATASGTGHQPISPRALCDITGAGDTVLATLGLAIAAGLPLPTAAHLANVAAGLQVAQPGVTPIPRPTLLGEVVRRSQPIAPIQPPRPQGHLKQISLDSARRLADEYRRAGRRIVFTNGCFDLLHVGHVTMLEASARSGDVLFVAINSDFSVRQLKGPGRPLIPEQDRARMLAALECVDHVLIFDDATPHCLLAAIRPDVLVKGGTTSEIVGREVVEAYGGRIERTAEIPGLSTTRLLSRIQSTSGLHLRQEVL